MKATETTVLGFIGGIDKVFIVPPFQRNYEWSIEQCDELFYDIIQAHENNSTHYLGNVVYYVGKNDGASFNEYILVDGQQRVTTILLLLCALRDSMDDTKVQEKINSRYLKNDVEEEQFRVRLKQTAYDNDTFSKLILGDDITSEDNHITENYLHFLELIENCDYSPSEIYETIPKLEMVDVNLQIQDDLNAVQTVFEKINATGKKLTPADLIRNFLLLADSTVEQEKLYNTYWITIERTVSNDNISKFARDYLIMNIFQDVPDDNIYKMFKEYVHSNSIDHEAILADLLKYSKYYAWAKNEDSPDSKINNVMKLLNLLRTDDLYGFYLFLFGQYFEKDKKTLRQLLDLLADFMIRFRIVAPQGGGGALRAVVHQLLRKIATGEIAPDYDAILFELSNSSAPSGRFPDDKEFKEVLKSDVNTRYARAALIRVEEREFKNISVPIDEISVEHLMPQTLSNKWKQYLGGKEKAETIYERYIDSIGNLTPISHGYNSSMKNKPWDVKRDTLKKVQFNITREVAKSKSWKEADIKKRNENIANRICKAVTGPLERTRQYQTKAPADEFTPGMYPLSDVTTPMEGTWIESLTYKDDIYEVFAWNALLNVICQICYETDTVKFKKIVSDNVLHKSVSKRNDSGKDPIISKDPSLLVNPLPIAESGFFTEGAISSKRSRYYARQITDLFKITGDFILTVTNQ